LANVKEHCRFRLLFAEVKDLRKMPLRGRRSVLKRLFRGRHDLIVMDSVAGEGSLLCQKVC
jgi:ATP-dependent DNA ligase